jgi:hypothetical protein
LCEEVTCPVALIFSRFIGYVPFGLKVEPKTYGAHELEYTLIYEIINI